MSEIQFLGIPEPELSAYDSSKVVVQSIPYEHTSSYKQGSKFGPEAILEASHFVEFYDEETDQEAYRDFGIATCPAIEFNNKVNSDAIDLIEEHTKRHLENDKFVVSFGAEHTITFGVVKAFNTHFNSSFSVLQIDAHSDLRLSYMDNPLSHASVMSRILDLGLPICQVGIRAQCKEESDIIKQSPLIDTWYNHMLDPGNKWMTDCIHALKQKVYITIDADGFDPSVMPAVGTPEPGGLKWEQALTFLRKVAENRQIIGFDIVECAPKENEILTQFNLAKLTYKLLGYINHYSK